MNSGSITVLGAGSYGTALAFCLARNGNPTLLWGRDKSHMDALANDRENARYLPGAAFPDALTVESDLEKAVAASRDILIVVPSHAFKALLETLKPILQPQHRIIWATKGLEPGSGRLLRDVALDVLGNQYPLAVLSGPTFAKEMAYLRLFLCLPPAKPWLMILPVNSIAPGRSVFIKTLTSSAFN